VEEIMRRKLENQSGMSLVEVTIILMVLAILTAMVAPAMGDYLEDARHTKAKEDVEAIGTGILRLTRDSGFPCLTLDTTPATLTTACTLANRVETLLSGGTAPTVNTNTASSVTDGTLNETGGTYNWPGATAGNGVDTNPNTSDDTNVPVANTPVVVRASVLDGAARISPDPSTRTHGATRTWRTPRS
jgi:type II secretory pathway pseudopilin PulG